MSSLLCPLMLYTLKKEKKRTSAISDDRRATVNNDCQVFEQCHTRKYHPVDFRPTQKALVVENFRPALPDEIRLFKGDHVTIILRDGDWLFVRKDNGAIFSTTNSLDDVRLRSEKLVDYEGFAPSRCLQLIIDCPTLGNLKIPAKYATLPSSLKSSTVNNKEKVSKFKSLTLPRKWPKFQLVSK
uniref:SH3 domain-containing protein n=1 Tax=Romanomermis culicivorax TaxID=13658 RepID=A0A915HNN9_ROMCU